MHLPTLKQNKIFDLKSRVFSFSKEEEAVRLEELVLNEIQKVIFDDELLERLAEAAVRKLDSENTVLPMLQKQYAEVEKAINNMLNAIQ